MTTQLDTAGPGIEDYRSSLYEVEVEGTPVYVYSRERNEHWLAGPTSVERSLAKWGADEPVEVQIALASAAPITSITVYPEDVVTPVIAGGVATFTVPPTTDLVCEINGDRSNTLMLFARPLKSSVPATRTDWTDLALDVASIDYGADTITFSAVHGLGDGDFVVFQEDAGAVEADELTDIGITPKARYAVVVVNTTTISLQTELGENVDLVDAGSSLLLSAHKCSYADTSSALYFPAGVHVIGRSFAAASNVTIYLDRGAVVIGGLSFRGSIDGVTVRGPGMFTGEMATFEAILSESFDTRATYAIFDGYGRSYATNTVAEVTVLLTPFYVSTGGVCSFEGTQFVSPWTPNTDGLIVSANNSTDKLARAVNCFSFVGDDNLHVQYAAINRTCTGLFLVNTQGAAILAGYHPQATRASGITTTVQDVDILTYADQLNDNVGGVIKGWLDGWSYELNHGYFDFELTDIRVHGPVGIRLFDLRNRAYPWGSDVRQQRGQLAFWTITRLTCTEVPDEVSLIQGLDTTSTPHDITFDTVTIGGTLLTDANYGEFIVTNAFVYNLVFEAEVVLPPSTDPAFVVEDGTGLTNANTYCSIATADEYFLAYGAPIAWTGSTDAQKKTALRQATEYLEDVYGGRWRGSVVSSEQALSWPRSGVYDHRGLLISSTDLPTRLVHACCLLALELRGGTDLRPNVDPGEGHVGASSITVGPVSLSDTYTGSSSTQPEFTAVRQKLYGLLKSTSGGAMVGLTR